MAFRFQAIDAAGKNQADTITATTPNEAAEMLRQRGLFITRLEEVADQPSSGPTGASAGKVSRRRPGRPGGTLKDVLFFTQQMSILMRSGARVVQALEAIESQCQRENWRQVITSVRAEVEQGRTLNEALSRFPRQFPPVYTTMVSAGEASGNVALAFDRLGVLTRQQQEIRTRVTGAMAYPVVLMMLCTVVIALMLIFVMPRFADMFDNLGVDLPFTTALLIDASAWMRGHGLIVAGAVAGLAAGLVLFLRSPAGRRFTSLASVRVPLFGSLVRNILFARLCRIWGQLLDSRVGLLEAVELCKGSTNSIDFRKLLAELSEAITEGGSIGQPMRQSWLVPPTFAAAIVTGEEGGKLGESLLFVAACLEDSNAQTLASLSRIIEPLMLMVMGAIVGTMALSLFLPMFDLAGAAGH